MLGYHNRFFDRGIPVFGKEDVFNAVAFFGIYLAVVSMSWGDATDGYGSNIGSLCD